MKQIHNEERQGKFWKRWNDMQHNQAKDEAKQRKTFLRTAFISSS